MFTIEEHETLFSLQHCWLHHDNNHHRLFTTFLLWNKIILMLMISQMHGSRKYPYLFQGWFFGLDPPS